MQSINISLGPRLKGNMELTFINKNKKHLPHSDTCTVEITRTHKDTYAHIL